MQKDLELFKTVVREIIFSPDLSILSLFTSPQLVFQGGRDAGQSGGLGTEVPTCSPYLVREFLSIPGYQPSRVCQGCFGQRR